MQTKEKKTQLNKKGNKEVALIVDTIEDHLRSLYNVCLF